MSVILNEAGLELLLETDSGPVGREVRQRAEEVTQAAREGVRTIMASSFVDPSGAVDFQMIGDATAVVGIRDEGKVSRYLDAKAANEAEVGRAGDWMRNALRVVFPS